MKHIANTHIITSGWGEGAWGEGKYGGTHSVIFDDNGQCINFDDCADALFKHWKCTIEKINNKIDIINNI